MSDPVYEAVFRPIVIVTLDENQQATITFDWSDSFDDVYDRKSGQVVGGLSEPYVTTMDDWTRRFPSTFRTATWATLPSEVIRHIKAGKKIMAIKELRARSVMGLAEAKHLVGIEWSRYNPNPSNR